MSEKTYAVGSSKIGMDSAIQGERFIASLLPEWKDSICYTGTIDDCVLRINSEAFGIASVLIDPETGEVLWEFFNAETGEWSVNPFSDGQQHE